MSSKKDLLQEWEKKARDIYSESLKLAREGLHGLEVMASKTVEVTRLKISNQKAIEQLKNLFMELGQRVYDTVTRGGSKQVVLTPDMASFIQQIKKVQGMVEKNLNHLRHLTTVIMPAEKKKTLKKASRKKTKKGKS